MFWFVREFYSLLERVASYLSINKPVGEHAPVLPLQHKCAILCESQLRAAAGDVAPATSASAESILAHALRWLIGDSRVNKVHPDVSLLLNCKGQMCIASSLTCSFSRKHKSWKTRFHTTLLRPVAAPILPTDICLTQLQRSQMAPSQFPATWTPPNIANVVSGQGNSALVSVSRLHVERNVM